MSNLIDFEKVNAKFIEKENLKGFKTKKSTKTSIYKKELHEYWEKKHQAIKDDVEKFEKAIKDERKDLRNRLLNYCKKILDTTKKESLKIEIEDFKEFFNTYYQCELNELSSKMKKQNQIDLVNKAIDKVKNFK